jgi:anaerobic selenocysteine-containing dehydrogenase
VPALQTPPAGVREDYRVLLDLALAVQDAGGGKRDLKLRLTLRAARHLGAKRALDLMLRFGPYGRSGMSIKKMLENPHGLDLGPLEPRLPERLFTRDRRLKLAPPMFLADLGRLEERLAAPEAAPGALLLIGRRSLRSNNSWMHNSARLTKGPAACTLLMNPADAAARGLQSGGRVQVRSRVGAIEAPLALTEDLARGVVCLPHGFGHAREGVELGIARAHAGASVNDLTDEARVDALSGNARLNGVEVTVQAVSG